MKNKGFLILFGINILLCITDFVTTLMNKDLVQYLETNPLHNYFGSFIPVFIFNALFFGVIYWFYNRKQTPPTYCFAIINALVVIAMVRCYAINNAIYWLQHPITTVVAQQIATPQAIQAQQVEVIRLTYTPYFLTLITFFFWKIDNVITRREI